MEKGIKQALELVKSMFHIQNLKLDAIELKDGTFVMVLMLKMLHMELLFVLKEMLFFR